MSLRKCSKRSIGRGPLHFGGGIRTVFAEMSPQNHRMIGIFERRGFAIDHTVSADVVLARKDLS